MNSNGKRLEYFLKDVELRVDNLVNALDTKTLLLMEQACVTLEAKTIADEMLITSIQVKAMVRDDLNMIRKNLTTIRSAIKLKKELNFEVFCLN